MDYTVKSSYQNINYTTTVFMGYTALFVFVKVLSLCGGGGAISFSHDPQNITISGNFVK